MKLSTAIRIGSLTTKQIRYIVNDGNNGRCVIGAALAAINKDFGICKTIKVCFNEEIVEFCDDWGYSISKYFPISNLEIIPNIEILRAIEALDYKELELPKQSVSHWMWRMNDSGKFTREQIADWVEAIEKQEETKEQESKEKVEIKQCGY